MVQVFRPPPPPLSPFLDVRVIVRHAVRPEDLQSLPL